MHRQIFMSVDKNVCNQIVSNKFKRLWKYEICRDIDFYINFTPTTNPRVREPLWEQFKNRLFNIFIYKKIKHIIYL